MEKANRLSREPLGDRDMMVKIYAGLGVGLMALIAGLLGASWFLIVVGVIMSAGNAALILYYRRRRRDGYPVP